MNIALKRTKQVGIVIIILLAALTVGSVFFPHYLQNTCYQPPVLLGLIEGLTEYLPISSTGHLILLKSWLVKNVIISNDALNQYLVFLQLGSFLAVPFLYPKRFFSIIQGLLGRSKDGLNLLANLLLAFTPAAILGLFLGSWIQMNLFSITVVTLALGLGGLLMLIVEMWYKAQPKERLKELESLRPKEALLIGICQVCALIPGTSRSMATILGAYGVGLTSSAAAEFSFLLGFVTLSAASLYTLVLTESNFLQEVGLTFAFLGLISAFIFSTLGILLLKLILQRYGLRYFAYYRILLALAVYAVYSSAL